MVTILSGCSAAILARGAATRNRDRPSAQIADAPKAAELPALMDHDPAIDAPHRRDEGVKSTGLRASSISVLTSRPMDFRDARVRSDCTPLGFVLISALAWVCSSLGFVRKFRWTLGSFGCRRARVCSGLAPVRVRLDSAALGFVRVLPQFGVVRGDRLEVQFVGMSVGSGSFAFDKVGFHPAAQATTPTPEIPGRLPPCGEASRRAGAALDGSWNVLKSGKSS
jgi:hypothetical protein